MEKDADNILSARKGVKLLDATLRDGGIVNSFYFPEGFAKALYAANSAAGIDIMEFGYKSSKRMFDVNKFGEWKFCDEENIRNVVGNNKSDMQIAVMSDVGRVDLGEIIPKKDSVIDIYRIATYAHQISAAVDMIEYCNKLGYSTSCNIMSVSKIGERDLRRSLETVAQSPVDVIYIVDSFGALYPEEIRRMCDTYGEFSVKYNKRLGIHAHNNQQLAFANTIEAYEKGVNYLDATVSGMGRGAGNCCLEAMLGFLKNPKYKIEPVLQFVRDYIIPLKKSGVNWGYDVPYLLTGLFNSHPDLAIEFIKADRTDYERFMRELSDADR